MLREYDLFKVVRDPGTDKVEQLGLGPAPALRGRDTGGMPPGRVTGPGQKAVQTAENGGTEHIDSIGGKAARQFVLLLRAVPVGEGLRGRDGNAGCSQHAGRGWQFRQRIDLL